MTLVHTNKSPFGLHAEFCVYCNLLYKIIHSEYIIHHFFMAHLPFNQKSQSTRISIVSLDCCGYQHICCLWKFHLTCRKIKARNRIYFQLIVFISIVSWEFHLLAIQLVFRTYFVIGFWEASSASIRQQQHLGYAFHECSTSDRWLISTIFAKLLSIV